MTLTTARKKIAAHEALNLDCLEAARRAHEISEAYSVASQHAASRQDAARVAVAVRRARDNERGCTYLISLSPVADLAEVWRAVVELERVRES